MDGLAKRGDREDDASRALRAAHVLVVEDSFLILMQLESILRDAGVGAVWPCRNMAEALRTIAERPVAAAILDLQIDREMSLPVARALCERGVPFFFYTGQLDVDAVRAEWPGCMVVSKPAEPRRIVEILTSLVGGPEGLP